MEPVIRMRELAAQVLEHRRRYYVLDSPIVSDAEYDALERELRELEGEHPSLADPNSPTQRVGAPPLESFVKARHRTPMLSLDNAYSEEELREWQVRVRKGLPGVDPVFAAELKVDGLSLSLRYEQGRLAEAITRGDGETGEVVTENAKTITDIPLVLPGAAPGNLEVRGEAFLSRRRWEELNLQRDARGEARFANPRNAASGTLKLLDSRIVAERRLQFLPWQMLGAVDHAKAMDQLASWGFSSMPGKTEGDLEAMLTFIETQREGRLRLPFDTDGVVIKVGDLALQERLGPQTAYPAGPSPSNTRPCKPRPVCWASPGRWGAPASSHPWRNWRPWTWRAPPCAGPPCTTPTSWSGWACAQVAGSSSKRAEM
jgi:DNA ligase (NAD+)